MRSRIRYGIARGTEARQSKIKNLRGEINTMRHAICDNMASRRLTMTLVDIFAELALTLAAIGLFGVMALRVTQRTREIGIRPALGAQPLDVFRLAIGNGL